MTGKQTLDIQKTNGNEQVFIVEDLMVPKKCEKITIKLDLPADSIMVLVLYDSDHQLRIAHQSPLVRKDFHVIPSEIDEKNGGFLPSGRWTLAISVIAGKLKKSKKYHCLYHYQEVS